MANTVKYTLIACEFLKVLIDTYDYITNIHIDLGNLEVSKCACSR